MQRLNNDPNGQLVFYPKGGPMNITNQCVNHGLILPQGKTLLEIGLFTLGDLKTDAGRDIEVAMRKNDSFAIYLVSIEAGGSAESLPVRIFPNPEPNELFLPDNFFNPYFNCHGFTFGDSRYWINAQASVMNPAGQMVPTNPNISILIEDEYDEVGMNEEWNVALFLDNNGNITHSIKKGNGQIVSKYDGYQLISHPSINEVDTARYGVGVFRFYRKR